MKALGFEITFAEVEKFFRSWIFQLVCLVGIILFGCMAFGPESIVQRLQLDGFRKWLGPWLGILLVFFSVCLMVVFVRMQWLKFRVSRLYKGKDADARIQRLSPAARICLCELFLSPEHGRQFNYYDTTFMELRDVSAVRYPSAGFVAEFPCYLQPWVIDWMEKHPEILEEYQQEFQR
ncbi:MAG: superinfection exclusion B family protein [Kiritimatiellae bacterium]|nr:superinfection exclusion B family protein [Bacteroidales bacterium]MBR3583860.1 superinfection exclusion B family protein [Kiritimatiellia bacterium]